MSPVWVSQNEKNTQNPENNSMSISKGSALIEILLVQVHTKATKKDHRNILIGFIIHVCYIYIHFNFYGLQLRGKSTS